MTPASTISELEQLIGAILVSPLLEDAEKEQFIDALMKGDFSEAMMQKIQTFLSAEIEQGEEALAEIDGEIEYQTNLLKEETVRAEPEEQQIADDADARMQSIVVAFQGECDGIQRNLNSSLENDKRETEAGSIDAIRDMLKGNKT